MYPPVSAFILYVQCQVKRLLPPAAASRTSSRAEQTTTQSGPASLTAARLLLPSIENDFKPYGFDELEKIDIALHNCSVRAKLQPRSETHIRDFFAIIECKKYQDEKDYGESLEQLIEYTRHVYRVQYNRRFAWALSVCGTKVYAVVMLHDAVLVSSAMDVSKQAGRKRFVELLVNWAVCDDVQAGYDPTMEFDPKLKHYRIQVPDMSGKMRTYTTTSYIAAAESLLGRHTRCFLAKPDYEEGGDNDVVVIKDAFAVSSPPPDDKVRNEIVLLSDITDTFEGKEVDFIYPELVRGGDVKLPVGGSHVSNISHNGVYDFEDNTDGIFSLM
ncbi:hypothetical protein IWQ56_007264, partial [Coemansia nantahalensis]